MHVLSILLIILSWLVALIWTRVTLTALYHLPRLPNLLDPRYDPPPSAASSAAPPQITVIVPARNEAANIEATLRSLLAQTLPLEILAVDDRSTDATGAIMDRIAAEPLPPGKFLSVIHIDSLPAGWLGKPHAMARAARQASTPWLLFTDADILFAPDTLDRALRFAGEQEADHVALNLTLILKSFGERMLTTVIGLFTLLTYRPWKVADPAATRDSVGIGGFNLIRSSVYRAIGGFEALRMEVLEDLRFGYEVKRRGFRQHLVLGRDLIRVHWASGVLGMTHNLTKNFFAIFRFRTTVALAVAIILAIVLYLPVLSLFGPWSMRSASLLAFLTVTLFQQYSSRHFTGSSIFYVFTIPVGAAFLLYALVRSWALTVFRGGVVWRGTFYPLSELRRHAGPLR